MSSPAKDYHNRSNNISQQSQTSSPPLPQIPSFPSYQQDQYNSTNNTTSHNYNQYPIASTSYIPNNQQNNNDNNYNSRYAPSSNSNSNSNSMTNSNYQYHSNQIPQHSISPNSNLQYDSEPPMPPSSHLKPSDPSRAPTPSSSISTTQNSNQNYFQESSGRVGGREAITYSNENKSGSIRYGNYSPTIAHSPTLNRAATQPTHPSQSRPAVAPHSLSAYPQTSPTSSNYTISPSTYESTPIINHLPTGPRPLNGVRTQPSSYANNSGSDQYQYQDRSSFSSRASSGSRSKSIPPSDAFYPMPGTAGSYASSNNNNNSEAARFSIASASSSSYSNGYSAVRPTILTTPPISQNQSLPTIHSSRRNESISSLGSTFSSGNYSIPSSNTTQSFVRKQSTATLSPHTSITPLGSMKRQESGASSFDISSESIPEYFNASLLSNIAVFVKDRVPRGDRLKGVVEHQESFTGEDLINTIQILLPSNLRSDKRYAIQIARSLESSLFFHEVDWDSSTLTEKSATTRVYVFPEDEVYSYGGNNVPIDDLDEIPTGVLTLLTECYSPFCGKVGEDGLLVGSCYSYSCPNKMNNKLVRQPSMVSTHSDLVEEAEDWASSVPKSLLESLPKKEIQRQSLIFELIQGEHKYLNDLTVVEQGFAEPLRESQIISPDRIDNFLDNTLLNISSIRDHSRSFLSALTSRQRESPHIVRAIGDIVLQAALDWGPAYTIFTVGFPLAESFFKEERARNPRFNDFLMDFHKFPAAEKRGFDTFHSRPTFRGLRYTLLLDQILKNTLEDDPDRNYLLEAISVIRQQSLEANEGISATKSVVACRDYAKDLIKKPGDPLNLNLLDPRRKHYLSTKVCRRAEGSGFNEWSDSHLILFDHYLVATKPPRLERDGRSKYAISRRAVPLELIQLKSSSFTDPPVPRSSGFHLRSTQSTPIESPASSLVYPITFQQLGRYGGLIIYFVESHAARLDWSKSLKAAIASRLKYQEDNQVVRMETLSDQTFGATTIGSLTPAPASAQFGKPTTSCPLRTTGEGQARVDLIVVGTVNGIYIGYEGKPRSMTQVVHLSEITQCAVLQEFGFILVVANKVLIAYSLEALVPSRNKSESGVTTSKVPQRLSGQKEVQFFRVGKIADGGGGSRTLVIYVKKSGVKESVFKALEPVGNERRTGASQHRFLGLKLNNSEAQWFRAYKEFFFPSSVSSIEFLRNKLAIVGTKGVEIMDIESLRTMTVPDFSHFRQEVTLSKRCEEGKTLGMFRLMDNVFLLVYNEFAFHIDKHGEPLLSDQFGLMDFESRPEQVAFHSPYLYAISPTLIEIRNAFTGELAQIITGSQIFLTFDGTGLDTNDGVHYTSRVGGFYVLKKMIPIERIEGRDR